MNTQLSQQSAELVARFVARTLNTAGASSQAGDESYYMWNAFRAANATPQGFHIVDDSAPESDPMRFEFQYDGPYFSYGQRSVQRFEFIEIHRLNESGEEYSDLVGGVNCIQYGEEGQVLEDGLQALSWYCEPAEDWHPTQQEPERWPEDPRRA